MLISRALNQDLQRALVDTFHKAKIILGLATLSLLMCFYYLGVIGVHARPIILTFLAELVIWTSYFFVRAWRPDWILSYNVLSLVLDVPAMTIVLHYLGGVYSMMWALAYLLLIAMSSLFLSKMGRFAFGAYVLGVYGLLFHIERTGVVMRHNLFGVVPTAGLDIFCWASTTVFILVTTILADRLGEVLMRLARFADLGRLSTELAHEIRTPLQVIQGLVCRVEGPEEDKREIRAQSERIARFVEEVLALGREDQKGLVRRFRIDDIVGYATGLVWKALPHEEGVELERRPSGEDLWVEGDPEQLVKAFSNLVRNGIDSMDGSGRLTVRVSRCGFEWVQVEIQDTGVGIYRNELGRIFEPFYTTKTGRRGIGLGLAISKKFIEANKGHIEVDSRPGQGSTFTVRLPLAPPPEGG